MSGDVSFVSARTREDAIIMVDERADAEGAENRPDRDFMVDFRLNDDGELELKEFGESCWNTILQKAYPVLLEAISTAPATPACALTSEGSAIVRNAMEEGKLALAEVETSAATGNRGSQGAMPARN